jgi:hypothetical protein
MGTYIGQLPQEDRGSGASRHLRPTDKDHRRYQEGALSGYQEAVGPSSTWRGPDMTHRHCPEKNRPERVGRGEQEGDMEHTQDSARAQRKLLVTDFLKLALVAGGVQENTNREREWTLGGTKKTTVSFSISSVAFPIPYALQIPKK